VARGASKARAPDAQALPPPIAAATDASLCYDYGASEDISECTAFGGTVLESACPTEGRVGSCHSALEDKIVRYYEGETAGTGWTTEDARSNCNIGPFVED
jgi:hypothetical protein